MGDYIDEYGFTPLQPRLADLLRYVLSITDNGAQRSVKVEPCGTEYDELLNLGYLRSVSRYLSGGALVTVSDKGARYFEDEAAYRERKEAWEEQLEDERKKEHAHDWRLNIVNGVYTIVGALIGYLLGRIAG